MVRRSAILCLFLFVGVSVTGCMWSRSRTNIKDFYSRVDAVVPGETKTADIPAILGSPPNNIIPLANGGSILLYTFGDAKAHGFNLLIVNFQKTNIGIDTALFITDGQGVVEEVNVSTNSKDLEWQFWPFGD